MTVPASAPTPAVERPHDPYAALRLPGFRWFVVSLLAMTGAAQIQTIVVAWQIYAETRDPLLLGLTGLAEAVPFIGIALFAGHVADRADRRRVSVRALAALVGCSLALLALTLRAPSAGARIALIYAVVFASGVARSFLQPARNALSAELVPREVYPNAVAWRSSTWQFAAVVGPAAGGLLYALAGAAASYAVDAALMVVALAAMARVTAPPREGARAEGSVAESLRTGLRFVWRERVILGALSLDLFSVLFGGATALLPIFAEEILHVGPQGLGALRAAPALGAVAMSLVVAHRPPMRRAGRALFGAVALFGVCMIGFGLSRSFALSLALLVVSGMADNVSVVIRSTLLQVWTPAHLLGRVSSVNQIFIGSSNEIGEFESGLAAKLLGTVPSVVLGGAVTLLVVAVTMWRVPELRRLREIRTEARHA